MVTFLGLMIIAMGPNMLHDPLLIEMATYVAACVVLILVIWTITLLLRDSDEDA